MSWPESPARHLFARRQIGAGARPLPPADAGGFSVFRAIAAGRLAGDLSRLTPGASSGREGQAVRLYVVKNGSLGNALVQPERTSQVRPRTNIEPFDLSVLDENRVRRPGTAYNQDSAVVVILEVDS